MTGAILMASGRVPKMRRIFFILKKVAYFVKSKIFEVA